MWNRGHQAFLNPVIELRNIDVSARKVSSTAAKPETNNSGDLPIADQSTARIAETSVSWSIWRTSTEKCFWNQTIERLSSIAEIHADGLKLHAEKNRMRSGVGLSRDSPKSEIRKSILKPLSSLTIQQGCSSFHRTELYVTAEGVWKLLSEQMAEQLESQQGQRSKF